MLRVFLTVLTWLRCARSEPRFQTRYNGFLSVWSIASLLIQFTLTVSVYCEHMRN